MKKLLLTFQAINVSTALIYARLVNTLIFAKSVTHQMI